MAGPGERDPEIDVVIPIHDALSLVQHCVRSVLADPLRSGRLVLVDDGSSPPTRQWCEQLADRTDGVVLTRTEEAQGFSAACNRGLELVRSDVVVVLNSDTIVPAGWTQKMRRRLDSHEGIGALGPLSNAASWQSVPEVRAADGSLAVNELPAGLSVTELDRLLGELCREVATPIVGMLNGFCLMLRRELLDAVGGFDQEMFPHGYGEEVDLLVRAADAGFLAAVAPDTFVHHAKSRSFGSARRTELVERGRELVIARHGQERLDRAASSTREHPVLEFVRSALRELDHGVTATPAIRTSR